MKSPWVRCRDRNSDRGVIYSGHRSRTHHRRSETGGAHGSLVSSLERGRMPAGQAGPESRRGERPTLHPRGRDRKPFLASPSCRTWLPLMAPCLPPEGARALFLHPGRRSADHRPGHFFRITPVDFRPDLRQIHERPDFPGRHLARVGPTTPKRPPELPLALWRLDRLSCCRTWIAAERQSPSARERVPGSESV